MSKNNLLGAALAAALAAPGFAQSVQINGQPLILDQPPETVNGQMMVPLRAIFEGLGSTVDFDPVSQRIRATRGDRSVLLTVGSPAAAVDGQSVSLSAPPRVLAGRTMVPLRFVAQALGAEVNWSSLTHTVAINTPVARVSTLLPTLTTVTHNGVQPMHVGDRLMVTLTGAPNSQATFEIVGSGRQVPMREIEPGRYDGELVLDADLPPGASRIVGRLSRDGKEATLQATLPLSLAVLVPDIEISPAAGQIVETPYPLVRIQVESPRAVESTRVVVDGHDVTAQALKSGRQLTYQPGHLLAEGEHGIEVTVTDQSGRQHKQMANFTVRQNITGATGRRQSMDVSITNLEPGSSVSDVFNVEGKTVPYAAVRVSLGPVTPDGQITSSTARADEEGNFNVDLDARAVPPDSPMTLRVQAKDSEGRQGPVRTVEVIRR